MPEGPSAFDENFARFVEENYEPLRVCARATLRGFGGISQPTAVLNEALAKIIEYCRKKEGRHPSQALVILVMRQIVVERARARGRRPPPAHGDPAEVLAGQPARPDRDDPETEADMIACLNLLLRQPKGSAAASCFILRRYHGLTTEQTAEALGTSVSTVERNVTLAQGSLAACMQRRLGGPEGLLS